ncbi:sensor histidine kinase [Intestinibacter sp.]|uniref:sensor histidine kinase n=1 Tax=Intestinibacter sp. TaxID=1965304 RepID=UPI003F154F99
MLVAVIVLCILVFILIVYIAFIQKQLRSINKQLDKRLSENTRQPLTIDLFSKTINQLAININRCLKLEEKQRLESIREQKQFKELISNISHDLRTPLTAIKGYQQLLEKETLSNTQLEKLHTAQKYTDELGDLIEHFFEYSYLITARVEPSLEKINLTNLAIDCVLSYIGIFEEKNISVHIQETPPIYVLGDKNMLTRVIENLLNNCAKHSLGDIDIKIESKSKARITFINPVNPDININVDKLFHRFYTGDSTRNKSTGLGLSIVEFLVEQMNGDVGAYLDKNKIAIFFEVPLFI